MRKPVLAVLVAIIAMTFFAVPPTTGQTCDIVCYGYKNSTWSGGVCRSEGPFCLSCFKTCDGQPYPIDYRMEPGHLVVPQSQVALADAAASPSEAQSGVAIETRIFGASVPCKNRSLFESLDRRRNTSLFKIADREPVAMVGTTATAPAVP